MSRVRFLRALLVMCLTTVAVVASVSIAQRPASAKSMQPSNTWLLATVSILGKCQTWYNGRSNITECINGTQNGYSPKSADGRYDPDVISMCPSQWQANGCWKGYATVSVDPYSSYELYVYVEAQDNCGSGWLTDASAHTTTLNAFSTSVTTPVGGFSCGWGHDERIHGFHEYIFYQSGNNSNSIAQEWTCSQPSSYTTNC